MELIASPLNLTLRHTFSTARSSSSIAHNVCLKIRYRGMEGLGEAAPVGYYGQSQQSCIAALDRMAKLIRNRDPFELESILGELQHRFPKEPSAIAAVDIALHDLIGKLLKIPLWKYWGLDPTRTPQTSFTIGIDTMSKVKAKIAEAERYPVL